MIRRHLRKAVHEAVAVDVLVHEIAEAVRGAVDAAHGQQTVEEVGPAEEQVRRVGRAQGAAEHRDPGIARPAVALVDHLPHEGHQLVRDEADPLLIAPDAPAGISPRIGPGLLIDGVDREHHAAAVLDPRRPHVGHMEILKIIKVPVLAGNIQHGPACVPPDLDLHVPAEGRAVFVEILCLHPSDPFRLIGPAPRTARVPYYCTKPAGAALFFFCSQSARKALPRD